MVVWALHCDRCAKCNHSAAICDRMLTLRPGPRRGSLRRSPRPPGRLGRGIPPPHSPPPLDAFGVSNLAPRFSGPPRHKMLATPVGTLRCVAVTDAIWRLEMTCAFRGPNNDALLFLIDTCPQWSGFRSHNYIYIRLFATKAEHKERQTGTEKYNVQLQANTNND